MNPGLRHRKRGGDIFLDSLRTCLISPSAVMMRTELFRALGGFDEDVALPRITICGCAFSSITKSACSTSRW